MELTKEKQKKESKGILIYFIKIIITFILVLILAYIIIYVMLNNFIQERTDAEKYEQYYINDTSRYGNMVAYGENGLSVTPIDAYIQNGMIYVKAKLNNNTGKNLLVRNYGKVTANATTVPFKTDFENSKTLNNDSSIEVVFNFGAYDVMINNTDYPNLITFELGADTDNNYYAYNLLFTIGWRYNNYYN